MNIKKLVLALSCTSLMAVVQAAIPIGTILRHRQSANKWPLW